MYVTIYTHMNVSTYGFVFMGMCDKTQLHILIQYQSGYDIYSITNYVLRVAHHEYQVNYIF